MAVREIDRHKNNDCNRDIEILAVPAEGADEMPQTRMIEIPESVFLSAESLDDLEDWLAANNPAFVERMRRIRKEEDLAEKGTDLTELLKRWPVE